MSHLRFCIAMATALAIGLPSLRSTLAMEKNMKSSELISMLHSDGPAPELADELRLYGQFVGDWNMDIVTYSSDGTRHQGQGEIHFGWALNGRAIQDVWMVPRLKDRRPDSPQMPVVGNFFGTTVRIYDTNIKGWRIYWLDPATNTYYQQIGRKEGPDIIQQGIAENGDFTRWSFTEIEADSFHWKGEVSTDKGGTWHLFVEIFARRT